MQLVVAVVLGLLIVGTGIALAANTSSSDEGQPQEAGIELPGKRTETSDTFRLPNGAFETQISEAPINYLNGEGEWKPIGDQLEETPSGGISNGPNAFDVTLPERLGAEPVRLSREGEWVSAELAGPSTEEAQLESGTASYESAGGSTSFDFSGLANGLKEAIEIPSASAPSSFNFALDASNGLSPELAEDGSIRFKDAEGHTPPSPCRRR
jgi:hypothetical protein